MDIIDTTDLANYLSLAGVTLTGPQLSMLVELANGEVSDVWTPPADPAAPVPTNVKTITLEVAARPARNPGGLSAWAVAVDDASRSAKMADLYAQGGIFLTNEERHRLTLTATSVGSIRIGVPAYPGGPPVTQSPYGLGSVPGQYEAYPDAIPALDPLVI